MNNLEKVIQNAIISNNGKIPFATFMDLALYTPGLGYYCNDAITIGREGDFVTAPELTELFAACFANQFFDILQNSESDILELGAGSGVFAKDLLLHLEKLDQIPKKYFILEISPNLRKKQRTLLNKFCPHLLPRIRWINTLPQNFKGIIVANEVMDAIPFHCFKIENNAIKERCVTFEKNTFKWDIDTPITPNLAVEVKKLKQEFNLPNNFASEINLNLINWINTLANSLTAGAIFLIDYGYGRREYYHQARDQGTLRCFHKHYAHDDPFIFIGAQDLTAHVDFTLVTERAVASGLTLAGFATQSGFLLGCDLLNLAAEKKLNAVEQYQQSQLIKKLIMPAEMGELIKVIAFTKNLHLNLKGFALQNRIGDL